ncbi:Cysteine desulfurase IscS [bioreactor metagenome]|uniref:Cysteine desulfurase IscS n=1 Tax=bioreactor metagenome TaxID=1076179 RepID=A0A645F625_9ZZZZ
MLVNNELSNIYPIPEIKKAIKAAGSPALLHTDAVQGYLKMPIGVSSLGADLITLSAHKIHGPKGCGALYVKGGANTIHPCIFGGGQENNLRSGTENTPAIAGFGQAVKTAEAGLEQRMIKLKELKEYTTSLLTGNGCGAVINSPGENSAPHILNISMPGLKSEVVLNDLDANDIYVSSGSACSSRKKTTSHVLAAAGFTKQEADSSIRISFGDFNEKKDCERLAECLKKCRGTLFSV